MAEEFEGRDFTDAVFWGVDLTNATLRDVNFTGARMKNVWLVDVDIDGLVDRLVVNGVDVSAFVNEHDAWYPLRGMLRPTDVAGVRGALDALDAAWSATIDGLSEDDFGREVEVLENGTVPLIECFYTVFEESFEHHRYALRDLAELN